jgi:hypothetical protein
MGKLYWANSMRMPMIAHNLLRVFGFYRIAVVERFDPVWPVLRAFDDLILLGERKITKDKGPICRSAVLAPR